ncbi:MAG: hypothetical protein JO186_07910, partial [Actinobacteria bacterium]|nr:hypothetical protein [Actinomycetota bacterium]
MRFSTSPLHGFYQIVDPSLLKAHLLQSIWYLHAQPPLYNLLIGVGLKVFGAHFSTAAWVAQIGLGLAIGITLYVVLVALGIARWWAAGAVTLFVVSPAVILFEYWLFYEYLVAALLLFALAAFLAFERAQTARRSLALFALLACVCLVRASFQIIFLLLVLAFMLALYPRAGRAILVGAAVPLLLVLGVYVKNWAIVGSPSTSSWTGMNLMQVVQTGFRDHEEQRLAARGIVSPITALPVFGALNSYKGIVRTPRHTGIPVLDDQRDPTAPQWNLNNLEYVAVSNRYLHDFFQVLFHDPMPYFRGVWDGIKRAVMPSSVYAWVADNRAKIGTWARWYDGIVLWQV